jgi:hypothetical protein
LHTPGGLVLAATQIARAVLRRKGKVTVFVPHYAMSGGTLIALAAREIAKSEHAVLGPVDSQLAEQPTASILKVLREKPIAEVDDHTLILADQAGKAVARMEQEVSELLADKHTDEKARELARFFVTLFPLWDEPQAPEKPGAYSSEEKKRKPFDSATRLTRSVLRLITADVPLLRTAQIGKSVQQNWRCDLGTFGYLVNARPANALHHPK